MKKIVISAIVEIERIKFALMDLADFMTERGKPEYNTLFTRAMVIVTESSDLCHYADFFRILLQELPKVNEELWNVRDSKNCAIETLQEAKASESEIRQAKDEWQEMKDKCKRLILVHQTFKAAVEGRTVCKEDGLC